ncbi:monovalent cation/H+ antiporter complex subunit F [Methylosinus sp. KRF6]|uniref:monovalent cation/H+ antiporter complex subunit F n=1 Tax=Methylosinus sp. KRF6 TaxID=2846853 RepID=UPI001C0CC204|nr:monovalent cation/H+ antiporter complex subunit F [Methylosinus sp. KRF6]MBU3888519.1 multiple resistance and pH regulation protein F [Methylosinus sp. KRF6]
MADTLLLFAGAVLLTIGVSLIRTIRGPTAIDRMMGAQLAGAGGAAVLLLLAAASGKWEIVDVALVLALLAAFTGVAFAKAVTSDGAGDPEEEQTRWR